MASVIDELMRVKNWWNDTDERKTKYLEKKTLPKVPLCPPQITLGLIWG
jgi:hypothetical protein